MKLLMQKIMNICLVHEEYPLETNFGGIATYQKNLAAGLHKLGHNVFVVCRSYVENQTYVEDGISIIRIFVEKTNDSYTDYVNYRKKVNHVLCSLEDKIDIIESPEWGAETLFYLQNKMRKKPIVVKLHTPLCIWLEHNRCGLAQGVTEPMLCWEKDVIENAEKVISCSRMLSQKVAGQMNIQREDITIIPNPANLVDFYINSEIKREYVLFCGSLEMRKGVNILAKAIPIVQAILPETSWVFAGKDTTRNDKNISMKQYIYELIPEKYHNKLTFPGQIENKKLNDIYAGAQVLVVPSSFDNFPYVVLEAMASGTPIIGSESSGITEMIENEKSGILCDCKNEKILADKIVELLLNKQKQKTYSDNALKRVSEEYSDIEVARRNIEIYEHAIESFISKEKESSIAFMDSFPASL